ncbi:MAG: TIGR02147 family protein [Bdellovibrionota bacterium]
MSLHLEILNREFTRRIGKNGRYSLRAYASFLGLHPSALSRVLTGKWDLTSSSGVRVAKKLKLPADERRRFMRSIIDCRTAKEVARVGQLIEVPHLRRTSKKISDDLYAKVAHLNSLALLELTFVDGFDSDFAWIAIALDMTVPAVKVAVDDLVKVGLLKWENGVLVNTEDLMCAVESESTSDARGKLQIEIQLGSIRAIENVPHDQRLNYGMTMAIDPTKIPLVREKVIDFIESMADQLECGERKQVYQLGVCLFPLSRSTSALKIAE